MATVLAPHTEPVGVSPSQPAKKLKLSNRLDHIDALRVLACLSVLLVHAISESMPAGSPKANAAAHVLHYGREVFFFVSSFVLVYVYLPRDDRPARVMDATKLRARRLRLVGLPYLLWTVAYLCLQLTYNPNAISFTDAPLRIARALVTGDGYFHLYFLLVTLQFSMFFPAFLWLLRRTQGYHVWLFLGSLTLQLATVAVYKRLDHMPGNGYQAVFGEASVLAYQLWFVVGGIVAMNYQRFHEWVLRNTAAIIVASVGVVIVGQFVYWRYISQGQVPRVAAMTLQPVTVIWSLVAIALLYRVAVALMSSRFEWLKTAIRQISVVSFAIYLVHPGLLHMQTFYGAHTWDLSFAEQLPYTAAVAVTVALLAIAIGAILHRTPFSLALIGRPSVGAPVAALRKLSKQSSQPRVKAND